MPVFYTTAWLWAKAFGTGVLTLRLYSCLTMCAALVVTWRTLRRFYGVRATAFGVLAFWGTSGLLLNQNVEARFYGLFILTVAFSVDVYTRLVMQTAPKLRLLIRLSLASGPGVDPRPGYCLRRVDPAGIGAARCLDGRFGPRSTSCHAAGWLALLVWVPAIHTSRAAGKPSSGSGCHVTPRFLPLIFLGLSNRGLADSAPCVELVISNLSVKAFDWRIVLPIAILLFLSG